MIGSGSYSMYQNSKMANLSSKPTIYVQEISATDITLQITHNKELSRVNKVEETLGHNPGDVVVIAGMGGNTIVDIISEVVSRTSENVLCSTDFVLQPQKSIERVREDLSKLGFAILEERVVVDRDIHYSLLHLKYSPLSKSITLEEKYLGPILITKMREGNNEVINYFRHLKSILEVRARGNEEIRQLLDSNIWEEIK